MAPAGPMPLRSRSSAHAHNEDSDDLLWLRPPLRGLTLATLALAFAAIGPEDGSCLRADCRFAQVGHRRDASKQKPGARPGFCFDGCLTMTYFRMGNPHYHRRAAVSRSCSGWEGVVPTGYGRQALTGRPCGGSRRSAHGRSKGLVGWTAPAPQPCSALTVMGSSRTGN